MTSIRDLLADSIRVGTTVRVALERRDGRLVADHPNDASPVDIVVVEDVCRLDERPPDEPVTVEILDRLVGGRVAARVVETGADGSQQ
ncbi:hypothetical protein D8Y22_16635 [Salinadaptatus halalkaliphilus]|uniref:TRAM domain-containing protein n=1 Tax=Salinadaptatus halalkaliphilus TaxID=2419781 RepID=A0A4S3TJP3_9EURY|nr:hypothetical protein [Salinadaptatus halalkaliphilus]THE63463.1 hypothetical protein D8Y22_16635 [Salinadaptatus halalkaliphilus]